MTTEMIVAPALSAESKATLDGLLVVRDVLTPDLSVAELQLFAAVAVRSGLDPFARQIYAVKRAGKMTIQTGIDGYRSIAARTGEYDGQDEPTFGPPCGCGKGSSHPESSTVRVYRKGMSRPVGATAFWHEYVPDAGQSGRGDQMWRKMPHVMIAKVAEALALRKAFPWDPTRGVGIGSDVYTSDEMAQADNPPAPTVQERVAQRASEGLNLRAFADAVRDMEPEVIRATRVELFPEATGVAGLTDQQRATLLKRLTAEDGEFTEDPGAPEAVEVESDEAPEGNGAPGSSVTACGALSDPALGEIEECVLPEGHRGAHKSRQESRWPRWRAEKEAYASGRALPETPAASEAARAGRPGDTRASDRGA